MNARRGQVAFFVIIGALILLATIAYLLLFRFEAEDLRVPAQFHEVQLALDQCAEDIMSRDIRALARNGGYLLFEDEYATPEEIRALEQYHHGRMIFLEDTAVPFWNRYDASCDPHPDPSCLKSSMPPLHSQAANRLYDASDRGIEAQLARSANVHVSSCMESYFNTNTDFSAEDLNVRTLAHVSEGSVEYDLEVRGSIMRDTNMIDRLRTIVEKPSSLKEAYAAARAFTYFDYTTGYLGAFLMDIVSLDSGVGARYPPFWDYEVSYVPSVWTATDIAARLHEDMHTHFPLIRLADQDLDEAADETYPYVVRRGIVSLTEDGKHHGDRIMLTYLPHSDIPEVRLNDEMIVQGEPLASPLPLISSLIPVQQYRTRYDISAPVLFAAQSKEDGLIFTFALEAAVRSNTPIRATSEFARIEGEDHARERERIQRANPYCTEPGGPQVTFQFEDESGPIDEVNVEFRCGSRACHYQLDHGDTQQVPLCYGAQLRAQRRADPSDPSSEALGFNMIQLDASDRGAGQSVRFQGSTRRSLPVSVELSDIDESTDEVGSARSLDEGEVVLLVFRSLDVDHILAREISSEDELELDLYPGHYHVDITVFREVTDRIIIPEDTRCAIRVLGICGSEYTIDEVTLFEPDMQANGFTGPAEGRILLAAHTRSERNPLSIPTTGTGLEIRIPIFDITRINEADRKIEHLEYMGRTDEYIFSHPNLGVVVS